MKVLIRKSRTKGKKYDAVVTTASGQHTIPFGAIGYSDFTHHKDESRKRAYITRHQKREDWSDPLTAGFWAKNLLWNKPSLSASIADVKKKTGIHIQR